MTQNSVFCIAFSRLQADQIVQRLKGEAFSTHHISVLTAVGPMIAALGDMARGLASQGIPLHNARYYEGRVREGRTLVSVQTGSDEETKLAKEIFGKAGGNDICITEDPEQDFHTFTPRQEQVSESRFSYA